MRLVSGLMFLYLKSIGVSRGFGFRQFKTELDAKKGINLLHGRLMGGKQISVQMAMHENRNIGGSLVQNRRNDNRRGGVPVAVDRRSSYIHQEPSNVAHCGAWAVKEGLLQVVKVADYVSLELKKRCVIPLLLQLFGPKSLCRSQKVKGGFDNC